MDSTIENIKMLYQKLCCIDIKDTLVKTFLDEEIKRIAVVMYLLLSRSKRRKMDKLIREMTDLDIDWCEEIRNLDIEKITDYFVDDSIPSQAMIFNMKRLYALNEDLFTDVYSNIHNISEYVVVYSAFGENTSLDERLLFFVLYYDLVEKRIKNLGVEFDKNELFTGEKSFDNLLKQYLEHCKDDASDAFAPIQEFTKEENARFRKMYREFINVCKKGVIDQFHKVNDEEMEKDIIGIFNSRLAKIDEMMNW